MRSTSFSALGSLLALAALAEGCDCTGPMHVSPCSSAADCRTGEVCLDNRCTRSPDGGGLDGGRIDSAIDMDAACEPANVCAADCCTATELCVADTCVRDGGPCTTTDDCEGDTYCETTYGHCVPYGTPPGMITDPTCTRLVAAGTFAPTVQCQFTAAPAGDPFPGHLHVLATAMVADFAIGRAPDDPRRPSIVAVFDDGVDGDSGLPTGVIRILDGATCAQTAELGSLALVSHSSPVAIGDLDGDGRPEIVANLGDDRLGAPMGGLIAFAYDDAASAWGIRWRATRPDGSTYVVPATGSGRWAGPSLVDLDGDGVPEIVRGGVVLDANGVLVDETSLGFNDYSQGVFAVVADVDADGNMENVSGNGIWEWDRTSRTWVRETWSAVTANGHAALGDFGDFPGTMAWPSSTPEVAVISGGTARVQTLDGTIVFGPVTLPGGGTGGPPTVADFDGDGRAELAAAGARAYSVFDLDCVPATATAVCASGTTTGVLWSRDSQDGSSNVTGSSVFDFEGDGRAEAVYGDECFIRVYDGASGDVLFSQARSSCTWYENPVVADVDGDYNAEIVMGDNYNCGSATTGINCADTSRGPGLGPRSTDPLFAGLRCADTTDCISGVCDSGFCRCTADTDCCVGAGCGDASFVCEVPPAGTPGTGNTCRASRPIGTLGIRVFRDGADNWVRSRMIWNQHAYFVTNVGEDGTVPSTTAMADNWLDPDLNNFRQNVPGDAVPGASPDLTTAGNPLTCDDSGARVTARICNRGTEPVGSGVTVGFYVGDPAAGGMRICDGSSVGDLLPGECEMVECPWPDAPREPPGLDVYVVADDGGVAGECHEGNNLTVFRGVYCGVIF